MKDAEKGVYRMEANRTYQIKEYGANNNPLKSVRAIGISLFAVSL